MADNLTTQTTVSTVPSGTVIATDDAGAGGHVQIVKLARSADGSATPVQADADGMLVNLGSNNDVTISDGGNVISVDDGGSSLTVDGSVSVSGTVAVTQSGTWDEVGINDSGNSITVDNGGTFPVQESGAALTALQLIDDTVYTDGTGTPSKAIGIAGTDGTNPQIIKTDTNGELQIDVLSSALPSGAATAANQSTANTALSAIQTAVETLDNTVSGSEMQVDVVGSLPAGTNNIGDVDIASITAGDNVIGRVKLTDGTDVADVLDLTNANPLTVAIVDGSGSQITSFGGGTQYTEGDTDETITGTAILWEDTSNTLRPASADKPLPVEIIAGGGTGGTSAADDADFTAGTTAGTPVQGVYESTPTSVTDGDLGTVGITEARRLKTSATIDAALPAGTNAIGKLAANSGVDIGDVDILSIAAGDNNIGNVDIASIAAGDNNIGNVDIESMPNVTLAAGTNTNEVVGDVAQDAPVAGNPLLIGGRASSAAPTDMSADGDSVYIWTTLKGAVNVADAGGTLSVDDGGGALTVDGSVSVSGTVAVTQSGTWDEVGINDSGNSITVDNGGTFAVQVDGSALTALQKIDDPVLVDDAGFTPATSSVMMAGFEADEASIDSVDEGDAGAARMTLDRKVIVNPQPHTAGGLSTFRSLDLDETEEDVKTSAGQIYGWYIFNASTSVRYVKFYNATAANTTVGTTAPFMTLPIPAASSGGVAANVLGAHGIPFDTALCVAATTGLADNDTGAPSANDVVINLFYK